MVEQVHCMQGTSMVSGNSMYCIILHDGMHISHYTTIHCLMVDINKSSLACCFVGTEQWGQCPHHSQVSTATTRTLTAGGLMKSY